MRHAMLVFAAVAALFTASARATDATLLTLIPPDAKVVAGVRAAQAVSSPFGQFVLSHLGPGAQGLQSLIKASGFDPTHDVSELLLATATPGTRGQGIISARGVFDPAKIDSLAKAHGCTSSSVMGVTTYKGCGGANNGALALPDVTTAILGDTDSVNAAISRYRSKSAPGDALQKQIQAASVDASGAPNDLWFLSLVPLSDLTPAPPADGAGSTTHQNLNAFQKVQQASGGVRFTAESVSVAGQLVMDSDKDAQAMADILRFLASMVQSNSQKNPTVGALASVLNALNLTTNANVTQVALTVPEAQVEQLLTTLQQQHHHAESPAAPAPKPGN